MIIFLKWPSTLQGFFLDRFKVTVENSPNPCFVHILESGKLFSYGCYQEACDILEEFAVLFRHIIVWPLQKIYSNGRISVSGV